MTTIFFSFFHHFRNDLIYFVDRLLYRVEKRDFDGQPVGAAYAPKSGDYAIQLWDIAIYDVSITLYL